MVFSQDSFSLYNWELIMIAKFWLVLALSALIIAVAGGVTGKAQTALDTLSSPLVLTDDQGQYSLGRHMALLEDPGGQLTVTEVAAPDFAPRFSPSQSDAPNFGFTRSTIWGRLQVRNETASTAIWLLEIEQSNLGLVDLYVPAEAGIGFKRQQLGFSLPFASRDIPHHRLLFDLSLPVQTEQTFYLRFQSETRMFLPLTLWTPLTFAWQDHNDQLMAGLYYGVLLIMAGYNLFLFLALHDRSYLYLVLFIGFLLLSQAITNSQAQEYFWPDLGPPNLWLSLAAGVLTVIFFLKFSSVFLETKTRLPNLHRLINFWMVALPALHLAALPFGFQPAIIALLLPIIPILLTIAWAGVTIWGQGFRPARYFVLAEFAPLLLSTFDILARFNLIPQLSFFQQSSNGGTVLLVLFLSFALADRVNVFKSETDQANRRLSENERRLKQFLDAVPVGLAIQDPTLRAYYVNPRARQIFDNQFPSSFAEPITLAENAALFPTFIAGSDELYPLERLPLGQALQGRSATADDIEVLVNERRVHLQAWSSPIFDEQQLVYVISAFEDVTERKKQEAELEQYRDELAHLVEARTWELLQSNQTLRQQRALAESLAEIAAALNRSLDQEIVLAAVLHQLKRVVTYQGAAIWLLEEETFTLAKAVGFTEPDLSRWVNLDSSHPWAAMLQQNQAGSTVAPATLPQAIIWESGETWLGALLTAGEQVIGVLALNGGQATYTKDEVKVLQTFADYAAIAVVNARLYQQAQMAATTRERERLARELHDAVTQTLFAASIIAEALPVMWQQAPPDAVQNVEKLRQLSRGALAEMRTLLLELRPAALLQARLETLLTHLSEAMAGRTRIPVNFEIEGNLNGELPPEVKVACYRVVQEAFNNIVKHARATQVKVVLCNQPQTLLLQIVDNGRGFDAGTVSTDHMGLAIMRERATAIGAALCIDSRPGHGTEVALQWPAKGEE